MRHPLPADRLGKAERAPAALDELGIGLLIAVRRSDAAVVMAGAALLVARMVEREQHFGDELAALLEHRVDRVRSRILEARKIGVAIEADHLLENEARVAHRRSILGHFRFLGG